MTLDEAHYYIYFLLQLKSKCGSGKAWKTRIFFLLFVATLYLYHHHCQILLLLGRYCQIFNFVVVKVAVPRQKL